MSLLAVQSLLAQLYTDSTFRARFFDDPDGACREMALTEAERQPLTALDRPQVERFARSLQQKRLGLARELLPGTARVMGDRFAKRFFQYCDAQPSALDRVEEAKAFAGYLSRTLAELSPKPGGAPDPPLPGYLGDLLTCECLQFEVLYPAAADERPAPATAAVRPGGTLANWSGAYPRLTSSARVGRFQYDMEALYPRIVPGEPVEAQPDPCFLLIGKVRGALRVRLKRINPPTARLLMLCDGTRTLAAIVDEVAAGLRLNDVERQAFAAECARFLDPLVESELIELSLVEEEHCHVSGPLDQA
jgi:hypothetical protein